MEQKSLYDVKVEIETARKELERISNNKAVVNYLIGLGYNIDSIETAVKKLKDDVVEMEDKIVENELYDRAKEQRLFHNPL